MNLNFFFIEQDLPTLVMGIFLAHSHATQTSDCSFYSLVCC